MYERTWPCASACQTFPVSRRKDNTKRIVKWKWSLVSGECAPCFSWPVLELGQDRHGTWLGSRRGNPVSQPDGRVERQAHDGVWLIPRGQYWIAAFWFTPATDLTIDICRPPTRGADIFSFVDLELDLYRNAQGEAGIVDQDEFAALSAAQLVSNHELDAAVATADELLALIEQRVEPFGTAAKPRLQQVQQPGVRRNA